MSDPDYAWQVDHGLGGYREFIPGESESVAFDFDYAGNRVTIVWWDNED